VCKLDNVPPTAAPYIISYWPGGRTFLVLLAMPSTILKISNALLTWWTKIIVGVDKLQPNIINYIESLIVCLPPITYRPRIAPPFTYSRINIALSCKIGHPCISIATKRDKSGLLCDKKLVKLFNFSTSIKISL